MVDKLTEIDRKTLPLLRDLYTPDGSKNYMAFTAIDTYIRWFEQDSTINDIKFFCLNDDFSDGTFVVTDGNDAYADTFDESHDRLFRLLQLIDNSKDYKFRSIRNELKPVIENALKLVNVNVENVVDFLYYSLAKEEAIKLNVEPPKGIELRPLRKLYDLEKVNSLWPYRSEDSLSYIQRIAKYNPNVGAFTEDGNLVAWVFRFPTGPLAALQTDENYYGKGYAGLVVKALSEQIAEMGHDVCAGILEENTQSLSLFSKNGFKFSKIIHLIKTKAISN